jgi:hypothetical protein
MGRKDRSVARAAEQEVDSNGRHLDIVAAGCESIPSDNDWRGDWNCEASAAQTEKVILGP